MPRVSVVIPSHNYGRYLRAAIDSALGQTCGDLEVIVVDDGSTDDSPEILRSYGDRIRWLQQEHQGVSAARNRGIEAAQGDFVAFLDADDSWKPDKLEKQLALMENSDVGMVYCAMDCVDPEGKPLGLTMRALQAPTLASFALLEGVLGTGSTVLLRRACLAKVGPFSPELSTSADWDFARRVFTHCKVGFVPEALACYRLHAGSMHTNVPLFERDMQLAMQRAFDDPASRSLLPPRRRCFSRVYLSIAAAYWRTGKIGRAAGFAGLALVTAPSTLGLVLTYGWRWWLRSRALRQAE